MKAFSLAILVGALTASPSQAAGQCDASRAQIFVGAIGTADVARVAMRRTHTRFVRWIQPGTMVTMDYREDRLNIRLDGRNFVTSIACG